MFSDEKIRKDCDRNRVEKLADILIQGTRGRTLGREIKGQIRKKRLSHSTYAKLSRWVNPERAEPFAQPIASEISIELFGEEIQRVN